MPKRKAEKHSPTKAKKRSPANVRFNAQVTATAASVSRIGPGFYGFEPKGEGSTIIVIEGTLDRPVLRDIRTVVIHVGCHDLDQADLGSAVGVGATNWNIVAYLPREQFADLLRISMCGKLERVELLLDNVRRGHGNVRSVTFRTRPVPIEAQDVDRSHSSECMTSHNDAL